MRPMPPAALAVQFQVGTLALRYPHAVPRVRLHVETKDGRVWAPLDRTASHPPAWGGGGQRCQERQEEGPRRPVTTRPFQVPRCQPTHLGIDLLEQGRGVDLGRRRGWRLGAEGRSGLAHSTQELRPLLGAQGHGREEPLQRQPVLLHLLQASEGMHTQLSAPAGSPWGPTPAPPPPPAHLRMVLASWSRRPMHCRAAA